MDIDWLDALEERVRSAAAEIERLRTENGRLEQRCRELEAEAQAAGGTEADGDWQKERAEIRRRVERLADSLSALLDE